jgi:hypothetical protein
MNAITADGTTGVNRPTSCIAAQIVTRILEPMTRTVEYVRVAIVSVYTPTHCQDRKRVLLRWTHHR